MKGQYYASSELKPVIGEWVEVRQESTKVMIASHASLPHSIKCQAVGNALKYTSSDTEAHAIVEELAAPAPDVKARKIASWREGAKDRTATEATLRRKRKEAAKKKPEPATVDLAASDNIVDFPLPSGGLIDLRSMEGDK